MRIQKLLASSGVASRRKSEDIIRSGRVTVNGEIVTDVATRIDECKDEVCLDGEIVNVKEKFEYYALHKPERIISSASDEKGRQTVVDMIKTNARLYPVGRLDFMSSGLILLTNDGNLTYKLTHPKHEIEKCYEAVVAPPVSMEKIKKLRSGVVIDGRMTHRCSVKLLKMSTKKQTLSIILKEGRNRQVRKMIEAVGSKVLKLKRLSVGKITLDGIKYGTYRRLTKQEIAYLKSL